MCNMEKLRIFRDMIMCNNEYFLRLIAPIPWVGECLEEL